MSPIKIFDALVNGRVHLHRLTIPEGYNLKQIAAVIADTGLVSEQDILGIVHNADLAQKYDINGATFEGYLFPDTYYFPKHISPEKMIATMVKRFWTVFKPEFITQARNIGFSIHEVITLASIIEKETGVAFERPIISSVFHNRLKSKMRLETDPTVIYGIENFDGNITRKHLNTPTPYNTYKISGLPPGPIANPGLKSIEAALYPADTDFLYFVSKKDRTHHFSTNFKEHQRAVRKYQLGRR
jgi:UPF0755 protein